MDYEKFTISIGDAPGHPDFPEQKPAPTDAEAAAPGEPFVNFIEYKRPDGNSLVVRYWHKDGHYPEELRIDLEILADDFEGTPATFPAACTLVNVVAFYYDLNGHHAKQGVKRLHFRDMATGKRLVGPISG